jgi:serine/threonine protein kinase
MEVVPHTIGFRFGKSRVQFDPYALLDTYVTVRHLDIKPLNVLVYYEPRATAQRFKFVLSDFGMSQWEKCHEKEPALQCGTMEWAAPEFGTQTDNKAFYNHRNLHTIDDKHDVWSVGSVLHMFLTGTMPRWREYDMDEFRRANLLPEKPVSVIPVHEELTDLKRSPNYHSGFRSRVYSRALSFHLHQLLNYYENDTDPSLERPTAYAALHEVDGTLNDIYDRGPTNSLIRAPTTDKANNGRLRDRALDRFVQEHEAKTKEQFSKLWSTLEELRASPAELLKPGVADRESMRATFAQSIQNVYYMRYSEGPMFVNTDLGPDKRLDNPMLEAPESDSE